MFLNKKRAAILIIKLYNSKISGTLNLCSDLPVKSCTKEKQVKCITAQSTDILLTSNGGSQYFGGRVGRGIQLQLQFSTCAIGKDQQTNGPTDQGTNGPTDGLMDG